MPVNGGCPVTGPVASPTLSTLVPTGEESSVAPTTFAAMRPTDIAGLVAAASPAVSPDGSWIAFVVATVDEPANRYRSQIWLAKADGARRRAL